MPSFVRKPAFWIALLVASGLCVFLVFRFFGDAFSVLDLEVRMSREQAIEAARRIATEQKLSTVPLTKEAASFSGDASVQTFIELEGGGKPALKPFLGHEEFSLYKWRVRLYTPSVEREALIAFAPDGRPSGFYSRLPEAEAGAALSADAARALAMKAAAAWGVDFTRYRALTASAVTRPGKRVDHEFVYERTLEGAPPIGEGRLRLRLVVAGDRLTQLQRYFYVPEAFGRRYATMRSVNNTIAQFASLTAGLVYGLGGCLIGLIWLMRRHAVRWGPSSKWAGVVALLITCASLAAIPGSWLGYDTATSASTHLIKRIGGAVTGGVVAWMMLTVVFATAEGLGRLAFGSHPQLWRMWRAPAANSRAIWGRTLAGYAWIGFDLAFIAIFYYVVQRYLGWWSPSDALIDPNILGATQPWISPVAMALQAGMMEEALFRAVPLAGAALLGRRFGRERLFIGIALVLQAVVFGCAHANYPGQPAYARPVELFVPALVWGLVYLRFGLLPGVLFHFGFDLTLMSIPLFVTDAPGLWMDRAIVIAIGLVPLGVLVVQRMRAGRLIDLPESERNAAGETADRASRAAGDAVRAAVAAAPSSPPVALTRWGSLWVVGGRIDRVLLTGFAVIGVIGCVIRFSEPYDAPGLKIGRDEAIAIAERVVRARGVDLDARWHRSAKAVSVTNPGNTRFIWREGGQALYARLIGNVLPPPHWEVRFARFDGDVATRDAWRVTVVDDGSPPDSVRLIDHDVPEGQAGRRSSESEARAVADRAISDWMRLSASNLKPVSAESTERPARVDWLFVYANPAVVLPAGGEARIVVEVDGDQIANVGRSVFVPDAWIRDEVRRDERLLIPRALLGLVSLAFGIGVLVAIVRRLVRGEASKRAAVVGGALMVLAIFGVAALDLGAAQFGFSVSEPFDNQMLRTGLRWLGLAAGGGLFAALTAAVGVRIASRAELARPASEGPLRVWGTALALALLLIGIGSLVATSTHANARVPSVDEADSWSPALAAFIGGLDFPVTAAGALIVAALLASRRRWIEIAVAAGFVLGAALSVAIRPEPHVGAMLAGGVSGGFAWWLYVRYIRGRGWVVPPLMLAATLITLVGAVSRLSYPGALSAVVAAAVASVLGYAIWTWLVKKDVEVIASAVVPAKAGTR